MEQGLKTIVAMERLREVLETLSNGIDLRKNGLLWLRCDVSSLVLSIMSLIFITSSTALYRQSPGFSCNSLSEDIIFTLLSSCLIILTFLENYKRTSSLHAKYIIYFKSIFTYIGSLDSNTLYYSPHTDGFVNQMFGLDTHLAIRDGEIVVLPAVLLVPGDVIIIKPGQTIFAYCEQMNSDKAGVTYLPGDIFVPQKFKNRLLGASIQESDEHVMAVITRSPLASYFEIALSTGQEAKCVAQPIGYKILRTATIISLVIKCSLIVLFLISMFITVFFIDKTHGPHHQLLVWFSRTIGVFIASFSSLSLHFVWIVSSFFVTLRFRQMLSGFQDPFYSFGSKEFKSSYLSGKSKASDIQRLGSADPRLFFSRFHTFWRTLRLQMTVDMENVILTLGTLSSVCCVNQEGVISQPLPTPEKVFFFHRRHHHHHFQENCSTHKSQSTICKRNINIQGRLTQQNFKNGPINTPTFSHCHEQYQGKVNSAKSFTVRRVPISTDDLDEIPSFRRSTLFPLDNNIAPVVLNVRTDFCCPSLCHFEKPRWDRFISSLKPIGLSILLNNCHSSVRKQRLGFFDNVNTIQRYFIPSSCITSLPLSFCLCGLASQIGFRDGAVNGFLTHGCLGAYSFCSAAYVANTNDSDGKDEPISQDTFPANLGNKDSPSHLAHSFSAVFSDFKTEDGYQLLSQGTGDILVSLCSDVWDGRDIIPLSERLRDLILGFHNRHLSSAYCVGFAYSPLVDKADESYKSLLNNLSDSSNILVLHLPGPDRVSPLLQRNIAAQHANRCRLNAKSPSLSHAVSTNDSDNSNDNDTVNNRPISAKCQSMSKLNGQFTSNFSKLVSKIKKIKFNSVSKLYHHKERSFATINIKNLKANGKRLRYAKNKLNTRNTSADMRGESELNPMNDSFDEYYDDSILGNFPKEKSVSEASAYDESGHLGCEQKGDFHIDPKEIKNILSNQIFLGLVSMQYQANPQVVKTIKQLHQACIRFVHFSRENELRSRVFAERLGLECGWNCHISLGSPDCVKIRKSSYPTKERFRSNRISFEREEFVYNRKYSTGDRQMNRSSSYSSLAKSHTLTSKRLTSISDSNLLRIVESDEEVSTSKSGKGNYAKSSSPTCPKLSQIGTKTQQPESDLQKSHVDNVNTSLRHSISLVDSQLFYSKENDLIESSSGSCHLSSSTTSTSSVSQSAGEQSSNSEDRKISELLIGNKSRLPYGIEGIRPHLENVDNVPLQVSLFTDCSPKAIGEMVRIMQEYGDTVCLVGSCYSLTNYALFMHSDVAIAVKPILPYSPCEFANNGLNSCKQPKEYHCSKSHFDFTSQKNSSTGVSMFDIAAHLIHLVTPCLLDMEKEGFRVYDLIVEAHISVNNLYHCLIFSSATPLSAGLLQLVLLIVGLPTRPVSLLNMKSNLHENELIWLPAQPFRSYVFGPMEIFNNLSRSDMQTNVNLLRFSSNCNLEPNFSIGQVLWFLFVVIPALSLSLIDRRVEQDQPLREPPIKRNKLFTKKRCIRFALVTCSRFIPSIIICVLCEIGHFLWAQQLDYCQKSFHSTYANRSNGENVFITNSSAFSDVSLLSQSYAIQELCLSKLSLLVYSVKDLIFYQFITYIVIISFSYANHGQRMWQFRYHTNPTWCIVSCSIVIVHSVYIIVRLCSTDSSSKLTSWHILSPTVLAFGFISCILLVFINEFVSWKESRAIFTEHRLSRLYFNTKLGMYSPV